MKYIHYAQPVFGKEEKDEVLAALDSGWVTLGPRTKDFEERIKKYVGSKYAIAVTSCTAALHISLLAAGIEKGDEVITTIFTMAATPNTIIHSGATPVFVDIDPQTLNINPDLIEAKITKNTKAIMPMDYGGQPCNYDQLRKIAKKHNLILIEDAATAIGAEYKGKKIGAISDLTCFSFHPVKNMSTGDGGVVTTNNEQYAGRLSELRLHGMSKDAWKRHSAAGSWLYDIVDAGFKYNMTDISAALGIHQLAKLDGFIKTREKYAALYDKAFSQIPEIITPYVGKNIKHARNIYSIQLETSMLKIDRNAFMEELKEAGIGATVYYIPLYLFTYYKKNFDIDKKMFPVTDKTFEGLISLPLYPGMSEDDVTYIIETIGALVKKYRK
ncbi:MAG TPA: DegT/DnrJ/EryC1/StrS family aminotransferase [Candidatus Saccharimonadales bacterium]|nr:DegT/DnrJ/EryC1/StrS family aminotransferase [Candidatus Saccharimonadales bacterium]